MSKQLLKYFLRASVEIRFLQFLAIFSICPLAHEIWLTMSHQPKLVEQGPCLTCDENL
jgi:hypothetical protein